MTVYAIIEVMASGPDEAAAKAKVYARDDLGVTVIANDTPERTEPGAGRQVYKVRIAGIPTPE